MRIMDRISDETTKVELLPIVKVGQGNDCSIGLPPDHKTVYRLELAEARLAIFTEHNGIVGYTTTDHGKSWETRLMVRGGDFRAPGRSEESVLEVLDAAQDHVTHLTDLED